MLRRRASLALLPAAALLLSGVFAGHTGADHERPGGTWSAAVTHEPVTWRHHNPWRCTNPPSYRGVEGRCTINPDVAWTQPVAGFTLGTSAARDGLVSTYCVVEVGQARDCGHDPPSARWTFAGSSHAIHQTDTKLGDGWLCPVSAGGSGDAGAQYNEQGHKITAGAGPEACGTFTSTLPVVSITGVSVVEDGRGWLRPDRTSCVFPAPALCILDVDDYDLAKRLPYDATGYPMSIWV